MTEDYPAYRLHYQCRECGQIFIRKPGVGVGECDCGNSEYGQFELRYVIKEIVVFDLHNQ